MFQSQYPRFVEDSHLESAVEYLSERLEGLADTRTPTMILGPGGVGCNTAQVYTNSVFAIRDFCWCEGQHHPEVAEDPELIDPEVYLAMSPAAQVEADLQYQRELAKFHSVLDRAGGCSTGCPPNFEHYASGVAGTWYKYLGRSTMFSRSAHCPEEANEIMRDCLDSLPGTHRYPVIPDPRRYTEWGWKQL